MRSRADADDLAQKVVVKAYFAIGRFGQREQFRGWI
ncbi:MAG: sigma factor [Vicinamibacterales bacterium]